MFCFFFWFGVAKENKWYFSVRFIYIPIKCFGLLKWHQWILRCFFFSLSEKKNGFSIVIVIPSAILLLLSNIEKHFVTMNSANLYDLHGSHRSQTSNDIQVSSDQLLVHTIERHRAQCSVCGFVFVFALWFNVNDIASVLRICRPFIVAFFCEKLTWRNRKDRLSFMFKEIDYNKWDLRSRINCFVDEVSGNIRLQR